MQFPENLSTYLNVLSAMEIQQNHQLKKTKLWHEAYVLSFSSFFPFILRLIVINI